MKKIFSVLRSFQCFRSWRNKDKNCLIFKEAVSTVPSGFDRTARVFSV